MGLLTTSSRRVLDRMIGIFVLVSCGASAYCFHKVASWFLRMLFANLKAIQYPSFNFNFLRAAFRCKTPQERCQKAHPVFHIGTCHCNRVKFRIRAPMELKAIDISTKVRFPRITIPCQDFESLTEESVLTFYAVTPHKDTDDIGSSTTETAIYTFCSYCGVHILYSPSVNPTELMVNADCIDRSNVKDCVVSYLPCKETAPADFSTTSDTLKECNRRGLGAGNTAYKYSTTSTTSNAQIQQPIDKQFPASVLYTSTPRRISPSSSSTKESSDNGKEFYDFYLKTTAASALATPSTASPNTDLSSGHTTGSAGKSSIDGNSHEWTTPLNHIENYCNEGAFFQNWPAESSEEASCTADDAANSDNSFMGQGDDKRCAVPSSRGVNKLESIKRELPIKYQQIFTSISPLKGSRLGSRSVDSTNVLLGTPFHRQLQYHLKAHLKTNVEQSQGKKFTSPNTSSPDSHSVQNVCV